MNSPLLTIGLRYEQDIVLARQRARQIAALLNFDAHDQTRIATAVSEIARNAYEYAGGGTITFHLSESNPILSIYVRDQGPGIVNLQEILDGDYVSHTGMGQGILGTRRLMDHFQIETEKTGTIVQLGKTLPRAAYPVNEKTFVRITTALAQMEPQSPFEEIQQQNQELIQAMDEVRRRQLEVERLNIELEETNRGVMALYAELDDRAERLKQASEAKSRFLSHMTHELRTPLAAIVSLARILMNRVDGELTSEQEKQVGFISESARNLTEVVNDLLDLAKIEAGRLTVSPAEFSISTLFSALRGMFRPLLSSEAVSLIFEESDTLPLLYTDEMKLSQILRNLVSNALKFTLHGEIKVSAYTTDENRIIFSVSDTGVGIPDNHLDSIFDEFAQVDNPLQKKVKGTGLGLPLSRQLAQLLGGSLIVTSELGHGSTFQVCLPVRYDGSDDFDDNTQQNSGVEKVYD